MKSWIPISVFSVMLAAAIGVFVAVYATAGTATPNVNRQSLAACLAGSGGTVVPSGDLLPQAPGTFAVDFPDHEVYFFYAAKSRAAAVAGRTWLIGQFHVPTDVVVSANLVEARSKHPTRGTTAIVAACVKQARIT